MRALSEQTGVGVSGRRVELPSENNKSYITDFIYNGGAVMLRIYQDKNTNAVTGGSVIIKN